MAKINAADIAKLTLTTSTLSVGFGIIGSYVLDQGGYNVNYGFNTGLVWCVVHTPVLFAAADSLRAKLGERRPLTIAPGNVNPNARKIPFTAGGTTKHILAHSIPLLSQVAKKETPEAPDYFTVYQGDTRHTLMLAEVEDLYRTAWRRQRRQWAAFSREYYTKKRRPVMHRTRYDALIVLLSSAGLILDREQGRSGWLWSPPLMAMDTLTHHYAMA